LIEKTILLENISLVDFLGSENINIKTISQAFPQTKIISRGNEISLKGNSAEIVRINEIINSLIDHYNKYAKVTEEDVQAYLRKETIDTTFKSEKRDTPDDIIIYGAKGVPIKARTTNQKRLVEAVFKHDLVFAIGPAGTGKTYVAVAMAVRALKNKQVKKIIITRPAVEAGESLGFLPGDLKEKIDPYIRPIYDALDDMIPSEKLKFYQEKNIIEIAPIAFMRGRTLHNAFVLVDEAQNTTTMQMKMLLTRLGTSSKMIVTGDKSQIDLPKNQKSGLIEAIDILNGVEGLSIIELEGKDVVRHKIVKQIIAAYDKNDKVRE
jgi:phosphate starvation-inducible PhoH-like protein